MGCFREQINYQLILFYLGIQWNKLEWLHGKARRSWDPSWFRLFFFRYLIMDIFSIFFLNIAIKRLRKLIYGVKKENSPIMTQEITPFEWFYYYSFVFHMPFFYLTRNTRNFDNWLHRFVQYTLWSGWEISAQVNFSTFCFIISSNYIFLFIYRCRCKSRMNSYVNVLDVGDNFSDKG